MTLLAIVSPGSYNADCIIDVLARPVSRLMQSTNTESYKRRRTRLCARIITIEYMRKHKHFIRIC